MRFKATFRNVEITLDVGNLAEKHFYKRRRLFFPKEDATLTFQLNGQKTTVALPHWKRLLSGGHKKLFTINPRSFIKPKEILRERVAVAFGEYLEMLEKTTTDFYITACTNEFSYIETILNLDKNNHVFWFSSQNKDIKNYLKQFGFVHKGLRYSQPYIFTATLQNGHYVCKGQPVNLDHVLSLDNGIKEKIFLDLYQTFILGNETENVRL